MREHNRMADSLRSLNPHWEDERLYQQARKIFTGQYQHIIYNEFLPRLLGLNAMNVYGMNLEPPTQYFTGNRKNFSNDIFSLRPNSKKTLIFSPHKKDTAKLSF